MDLSTIESALIVLALINIAVLCVAAMVFNQNCKLQIQIKYIWLAIDVLEELKKRKQEAA